MRCASWASTPVRALLAPRVVAVTLVSWLINSLVTLTVLIAAFLFSVGFQHVTPGAFVAGLTLVTGLPQLGVAMVKATVFGLTAGLLGVYQGTTVKGGPAGVGNAVNQTVVYSFSLLFFINIILTRNRVRGGQVSIGTVARQRFPETMRALGTARSRWAQLGEQARFFGKTLAAIVDVVVYYRGELLRQVAAMSLGTGSLAVIGGSVAVMAFLTMSTGGTIASEGFNQFSNIGVRSDDGIRDSVSPTPDSSRHSLLASRSRPRSAPAPPHNWARCGSMRKSTRWRLWASAPLPTSPPPESRPG